MPAPKTQLDTPNHTNRIAVGMVDKYPIVLVEATGALGVLVAQRYCPDDKLERVLYYRSLMGQPYACFFDTVELLTIDGTSVARTADDQKIFFEPNSLPYVIKNISREQYEKFVDDVVTYQCEEVDEFIAQTFSTSEGFSIAPDGSLNPPDDYANAMVQFLSDHSFVQPNEPTK